MLETSPAEPITTSTTCPYCGVGCGVLAKKNANGTVSVAGNPAHPSNFGRLCSKGAALADTIDLDGRLLHPIVNDNQVSWQQALQTVASQFKSVIEEHGANAVAFYVSGQLLTEDYYVANKLMKGFIGSGNIDTNSRLCMSSAVAGYKRAFGADAVPCCYEDLEQAKLIILVGSNTAWCHPVVFQRISQRKQEYPELKIIVIDPRKTATCEIADLHLAIKPGTDQVLFNGLLAFLEQQGHADTHFIEQATEGLAAALTSAKEHTSSIAEVSKYCGLEHEEVAQFYHLFARHDETVTLYSQGINQSSHGTDRCNSIINVHLLTGRIGKAGMGPFSITGQPNAMGGREVGGLANMLAAHMEFNDTDIDRVNRFWKTRNTATEPGLKAIDLFNAVGSGQIKAIWIMATNPAASMPDANTVKQALEKCEFVVVSDCMQHTDTTDCANVLLPATTWGEKNGTVTNSERRISRQRAFLSAPGEAWPDWKIICEVAKHMGFEQAFKFNSPYEIFQEHAALSGFENEGTRDFDLSGLTALDQNNYHDLQPIQWPVTQAQPQGTRRLFSDRIFFTPSKKAQFISVQARSPKNPTNDTHPLILNTGRVRDQWHTMTRTSKSARLSTHKTEPYVEINLYDASQFNIKADSLVQISSQWGQTIARAVITGSQQRGTVFIPFHWNRQFSAQGCVASVVNPVADLISGQPELKHTPVNIKTFNAHWYGFILSRRTLDLSTLDYWVKVQGKQFIRYEIAALKAPEDWPTWSRQLLCAQDTNVEWQDYLDASAGRYRGARLTDGRLESCLFISQNFELPSRRWLADLFVEEKLSQEQRICLLAGQPGKGMKDQGKLVCACFGVGENTLIETIQDKKLTSVEDIGQCLQAGTNCGSCIPELKSLLTAINP